MENLTNKLKNLKSKLEELITKYENYFGGLEKSPPVKLHEEISKEIKSMVGRTIFTLSQQFLFNHIVQRLRTYEVLWEKLTKKREDELSNSKKTVMKPTPPRTRQFFKLSTGKEKEEVKKLYQDFVKSGKEGGKTLPFHLFEKHIEDQVNTIKKKFFCSSVIVWIEKEGEIPRIKAKPE